MAHATHPPTEQLDDKLTCWVYRSSRRDETYLYLARQDDFDSLPAELLKLMGAPSLVMELELRAERKLARVKATDVIAALRANGFYLQLPPEIRPTLRHGE